MCDSWAQRRMPSERDGGRSARNYTKYVLPPRDRARASCLRRRQIMLCSRRHTLLFCLLWRWCRNQVLLRSENTRKREKRHDGALGVWFVWLVWAHTYNTTLTYEYIVVLLIITWSPVVWDCEVEIRSVRISYSHVAINTRRKREKLSADQSVWTRTNVRLVYYCDQK